MSQQLFVPYPPMIDGTSIGFSTAPTVNQNLKEMVAKSTSSLEPERFAISSEEPTAEFESPALDVILGSGSGKLGISLLNGLFCSSGAVFQYQQQTGEGGFDGDDVHVTMTSAKAFAFIESISAKQDDQNPAMAKLKLLLLRSGSTYPQILAVDQALAGALALTNMYSLGPVYVDGSEIAGLQGIEYVTGFEVEPKRAGGATVAEQVHCKAKKHELRLQFQNVGDFAAQGFGMSELAGTMSLYLRHISAGGGRTANTGSGNNKHIKISWSGGVSMLQEIKANGDDSPAELVPTFFKRRGDTLTVSLTSAIP